MSESTNHRYGGQFVKATNERFGEIAHQRSDFPRRIKWVQFVDVDDSSRKQLNIRTLILFTLIGHSDSYITPSQSGTREWINSLAGTPRRPLPCSIWPRARRGICIKRKPEVCSLAMECLYFEDFIMKCILFHMRQGIRGCASSSLRDSPNLWQRDVHTGVQSRAYLSNTS